VSSQAARPSLFGTILDRSRIIPPRPVESSVPAHRQYLPGTMVLSTTCRPAVAGSKSTTSWLSDRGTGPANVRCCNVEPRRLRRSPRAGSYRQVPARSVDVMLNCEPSFNYGRVDAEWEYTGTSYDHVSTTNADYNRITVTGDMRFGIEGRAIRARHRLVEGESCFVVMSWTDAPLPTSQEEVNLFKSETSRFWRGWIDGGQFRITRARTTAAKRAHPEGALLRPTGAILAAPTTSLPRISVDRELDYRYTWIRDTAFALRALHALGFHTEADDFLAFLGDVLEPPRGAVATTGVRARRHLQVLYPSTVAIHRRSRTRSLTATSGADRRASATVPTTRLSSTFWRVVDCIYEHTRSRDALMSVRGASSYKPWKPRCSAGVNRTEVSGKCG